MSTLKVNRIVNATETAGPTLTFGGTVASGYQTTVADGVTVSGVATASSYSGDGSNMTGLPTMTEAKVIAYRWLTKYDEFRL